MSEHQRFICRALEVMCPGEEDPNVQLSRGPHVDCWVFLDSQDLCDWEDWTDLLEHPGRWVCQFGPNSDPADADAPYGWRKIDMIMPFEGNECVIRDQRLSDSIRRVTQLFKDLVGKVVMLKRVHALNEYDDSMDLDFLDPLPFAVTAIDCVDRICDVWHDPFFDCEPIGKFDILNGLRSFHFVPASLNLETGEKQEGDIACVTDMPKMPEVADENLPRP